MQLVTGLFEHEKKAAAAIKTLKRAGFTRDISVISKDAKTGMVSLYQVKQEETEEKDEALGGEIGGIAGVVGGLSALLNPALAAPPVVLAFATTMGVVGAALGEALGGFIGDVHHADIQPERAAMYRDRIKKGEVFIAVSCDVIVSDRVQSVFRAHRADEMSIFETKD